MCIAFLSFIYFLLAQNPENTQYPKVLVLVEVFIKINTNYFFPQKSKLLLINAISHESIAQQLLCILYRQGLTTKHMDFILVALSLSLSVLGDLVMPFIHINFI